VTTRVPGRLVGRALVTFSVQRLGVPIQQVKLTDTALTPKFAHGVGSYGAFNPC
jgi:hypothetical protein